MRLFFVLSCRGCKRYMPLAAQRSVISAVRENALATVRCHARPSATNTSQKPLPTVLDPASLHRADSREMRAEGLGSGLWAWALGAPSRGAGAGAGAAQPSLAGSRIHCWLATAAAGM